MIGFKQDIFEAVVERKLLTKLLPIIDYTDQSSPPFTRLAAEHHLEQTDTYQVLLLIETSETRGGTGEGEETVSWIFWETGLPCEFRHSYFSVRGIQSWEGFGTSTQQARWAAVAESGQADSS